MHYIDVLVCVCVCACVYACVGLCLKFNRSKRKREIAVEGELDLEAERNLRAVLMK